MQTTFYICDSLFSSSVLFCFNIAINQAADTINKIHNYKNVKISFIFAICSIKFDYY